MTAKLVRQLVVTVACLVLGGASARCARAQTPNNLFANPGFELGNTGPWRLDKGGKTSAGLTIDDKDAAEGRRSALVAIDSVADWGTQFGQSFQAGKKGKTYTFAVLARAVTGRVRVDLQIERAAKPWDLAARGKPVTLSGEKWTELHVTFKVEKDFSQGWFAYLSCTQPKCRYRADMFRLYEGPYVPYEQAARQEAAIAAVRLFDTGRRSAGALSADALAKRAGWTPVPQGSIKHAFKGDAVFLNDKIAVALRPKAGGAEVYGQGPAGAKLRAILAPAASVAGLSSVRITKNEPGEVAVDVTFEAPGGKPVTLGYAIKIGQVFVQTSPRTGAAALQVQAPCRFAVLPDFFADDIVADATRLGVAEVDLPSEHFLLQMIGRGDAIVMSVWNVAGRDVRVALGGRGDKRVIQSSDIPYGKKGNIWVAVLEGPDIWHARKVAGAEAGRIIPLDWRAPYPALWRVDWTRNDKLTGSWEMINQRSDGRFTKHTWLGTTGTLPPDRKRWTTVLGRFQYPCWTDRAGRGHLQPLKKVIRFDGPAVIYPINRVSRTPLDRFSVVDVMRGTLGVGPCEYILDVENQHSRYKGRATCSTRDSLGRIYGSKQQKRRKAEIEKILAEMMVFIRHIRGRIESYVAFGHELGDYLAARKKAHPELGEHIAELETLTRAIDQCLARRRSEIKTPDHVAGTVEEFRKTLLTYEGPDAPARVKKFTHAWVRIGGSQDELVGECRMAVKWVRQRAGLLMATEPRMAEIAREVRRRTQKVLRNPAGHEGANH